MTFAFSNNLAYMANIVIRFALLSALVTFVLTGGDVLAKSAYSPRHSGLEPPGGPRSLEAMPGRAPGRTAEGGMGYTDAYGNTVQQYEQEKKSGARRLRRGAYGNDRSVRDSAPLPNPEREGQPLWSFQ